MADDLPSDTASTPQTAPPRRKFAIEPIETSTRSSKVRKDREQAAAATPTSTAATAAAATEHKSQETAEKPVRKFLPQPVEESSRSSRRRGGGGGGVAKHAGEGNQKSRDDAAPDQTNGTAEKKPRRFAVEPVETVKRVRRRNSGPALQPGDRTDERHGEKARPGHHLQLPGVDEDLAAPANSPNYGVEPATGAPESRFSYANLARKASRQSSMRKPTLEPISSVPESEESVYWGRRSSSSDSSAHEDARQQLQIPRKKRQPRQKESYEEGFNGYLLDMAARAAQQQLREQVAEAYPNERYHEPVDHFAAGRESDSDFEAVGQLPETRHEEFKDRRESSAGWDAQEFRRHKEKLEEQKQEQRKKVDMKIQLPQPDSTRITPRTPKKDPFGNPFNLGAIGAEGSKDPELSRMQDKARPPMLGNSLVFPRCQSPRTTLIDPLQRHGTRKNAGLASPTQSGLWTPEALKSPRSPPPKTQSPQASVCLWGGNCTADQAAKMRMQFGGNIQTGIMTPQLAPDEDPFERYGKDESLQTAHATLSMQYQQLSAAKVNGHGSHQLPSSPGSRVQSVLGIDQLLSIEQRIEDEYPDAFVTQIYNYLSLGYPAIARSYDEELSRISKVSIHDIRRDDGRKNTKGYVGAPEGNGSAEDTVREDCGRWKALKLYIREWARQQPNMMDEGADNNWGARARRGSWFA